MTLDTNCVIYAAQQGQYLDELVELVSLAQASKLSLFLTGAFELDQETAGPDNKALNLEWLRERPVIRRVPQPFRFNFSPFNDPGHGFLAGQHAASLEKLERIILPADLRPGQFDPAQEPALQAKFRNKLADVQHLGGHLMSGNDYFITNDKRDMLKKRDRILAATSIRVVNPIEAVQIARGSSAPTS
jgi:hypothetical protein